MKRCLLLMVISLIPLVTAWGGHTLSSEERKVLESLAWATSQVPPGH